MNIDKIVAFGISLWEKIGIEACLIITIGAFIALIAYVVHIDAKAFRIAAILSVLMVMLNGAIKMNFELDDTETFQASISLASFLCVVISLFAAVHFGNLQCQQNEQTESFQKRQDERDQARCRHEDEACAVRFLQKYDGARYIIPLCGIASMLDKTYLYNRAVYRDFCLQIPEVQKIILNKCGVVSEKKDFREQDFLNKYLSKFREYCKDTFPKEMGSEVFSLFFTDGERGILGYAVNGFGDRRLSDEQLLSFLKETIKEVQFKQDENFENKHTFDELAACTLKIKSVNGYKSSQEYYAYGCCCMRAIACSGHPKFDIKNIPEGELSIEDVFLMAWYECYMNL